MCTPIFFFQILTFLNWQTTIFSRIMVFAEKKFVRYALRRVYLIFYSKSDFSKVFWPWKLHAGWVTFVRRTWQSERLFRCLVNNCLILIVILRLELPRKSFIFVSLVDQCKYLLVTIINDFQKKSKSFFVLASGKRRNEFLNDWFDLMSCSFCLIVYFRYTTW